MGGCPTDSNRWKCPKNTYCKTKDFSPMQIDVPQKLNITERQLSAFNNMKKTNKENSALKLPTYKPLYKKDGKKFTPVINKKGHIFAYACHPITPTQLNFAKNNSAYTDAFKKASQECRVIDKNGNVIIGNEHLFNRENRNACYSKVIERELSDSI